MWGWFRRRHEDKLRWTNLRSQVLYCLPESPREYLDPLSRQEVARRAERMMERFGLVKEGVLGIARHTVGTGLTAQLNSDDHPWNAEGEAQWLLYSLTKSRCDLANRRDAYGQQNAAVQQISLRGEFFSASVKNPRHDDEPCSQLFDSTEIETPEELVEDPQIYDGVRLGEANDPLGYMVKKAGGGHREIPVQQMFHWYEPIGINQVRGQSAFSPVLDKLVDWDDLQTLVVQGAKVHKSLAVVVNKLAKAGGQGFAGGIGRAAPGGGATNSSSDTRALEKAFPGLVSYLGEHGEAKVINSSSPDQNLEPFISKLITPDVFLALGWPGEFFWGLDKLGSAAQRFVLIRADARAKQLSDDLIYQSERGKVFRFLSYRIEKGLLRKPTDPRWGEKIGFQQPARATLDNGRDGKLEQDQLGTGTENLRGVWDRRGKNYREEAIRQWLREWAEFFEEHEKMRAKLPTEVQKLWDTVPTKWRAGVPGSQPVDVTASVGGKGAADETPAGKKETAAEAGAGGDRTALADPAEETTALKALVCQLQATKRSLLKRVRS